MEAVYVEGSFDGMRIDAFLAAVAAFPTRSAAARRVDAGEVRVNGAVVRKSFTVRTSDVVEYVVAMDARVLELMPADIPLDIRYEDDDVIVLSKQAGLVTHPADGHPEQDTLVNALIAHCGREKLCNVQGEQDRLGIVHRLDRDTSGLMLAAKTDAAGLRLMEDIAARDVDRHYLALVHGWIPLDTGLIDAPIGRSAKDRLRMCVSDRESARPASTSFRVVRRFEPSRRDDDGTRSSTASSSPGARIRSACMRNTSSTRAWAIRPTGGPSTTTSVSSASSSIRIALPSRILRRERAFRSKMGCLPISRRS